VTYSDGILLVIFILRAKYKRSEYVPRPGNNAPLAARNTDHVSSIARLLSLVCGAGEWGKICCACDQDAIQYTE
jgi:hypothetical protein